MSFLMTFIVAVKALRRNAMRTALTALGMIIGVAAVIVMVAIGTGARTSIEKQIQSAGSNIVMVSAGSGGFGPVRQGQGAVTTLTECLWGQLRETGSLVSASLLYPSTRSPGMLNTGIWRPGANRPERLRCHCRNWAASFR